MMLVAFGCSLFTLIDLRPLIWMVEESWRKTLIAGLMYKFFWFRVMRHFVRVAIRTSTFKRLGKLGRPLELWLWGTAMSRDTACSAFIFWTMSPLVVLSSLSQATCPTWSFHHMLVYRQPGHSARDSVDAVECSKSFHDGEESDYDSGNDIDVESNGEEDHFVRP